MATSTRARGHAPTSASRRRRTRATTRMACLVGIVVVVQALLAPSGTAARATASTTDAAGRHDAPVRAGLAPSVLSPSSVLIPCTDAAAHLVITADSHLDPSCTYTGGVTISTSDVVLDCQGATIADPDDTHGRGIEISTPADTDLADVTVRNCAVRGFVNGIRTTRTGFRSLPPGGEYDHGLTGVVLEHLDVADTRGAGIYVDGYVTHETIRDSMITNAGSTGIYLEAGSADNVVTGNELVANGFKANGPAGQLTKFAGTWYRFWGTGREAIAIDGSRRNRVAGNHFVNNSYGGVLLYKNCGEYVTQKAQWFERRYGADDNVIEDNVFDGGPNGVWVASRQNENTFLLDCSDVPYIVAPGLRVRLDHAARTTIRNNTFNDVEYGVRVEDDGAVVQANTFTGADASRHAVIVGTQDRTVQLHQPVTDTTITDNVSTIVDNLSPYRWVHSPTGSVVSGNVAMGQPVGWCQGKQIPTNVFLFVIALTPEDPNGPVTPTPDLTKGSLGPLPPCPGVVAPTTTTTTTTSTTTTTAPVSTSTTTTSSTTSTTTTPAPTAAPVAVAAAAPARAVTARPVLAG